MEDLSVVVKMDGLERFAKQTLMSAPPTLVLMANVLMVTMDIAVSVPVDSPDSTVKLILMNVNPAHV